MIAGRGRLWPLLEVDHAGERRSVEAFDGRLPRVEPREFGSPPLTAVELAVRQVAERCGVPLDPWQVRVAGRLLDGPTLRPSWLDEP